MKKFKDLPIALVGINADGEFTSHPSLKDESGKPDQKKIYQHFVDEGGSWRSFYQKEYEELLPKLRPEDSFTFGSIPLFYVLDKNGVIRDFQVGGGEDGRLTKTVSVAQGLLREMGHDANFVSDEELLTAKLQKNTGFYSSLVQSRIARGVLPGEASLQESLFNGESVAASKKIIERINAIEFQTLSTLRYSSANRMLRDLLRSSDDSETLHEQAWVAVDLIKNGIGVHPELQHLAKEALSKAMRLAPEDANIVDSLAQLTFYGDGNVEEAIRLEEKALELDEDNDSYKKFLETAKQKLAESEGSK